MSRDRTQLRTSQIDVDEFGEYLPPVQSPPRSTQASPRRTAPIASPRAVAECPNASTSNITMRPSGIRPIVSPRSQVVVSPRVTRERRARASPATTSTRRSTSRTTTPRSSTSSEGTRVSARARSDVPTVEKSSVASERIVASPTVRKEIDNNNLQYLDYRFDSSGGVYTQPSELVGGRKARREPVNIERPLQGVSSSVERMVPKVDRGPVPALKDRTLGEFITKTMFNKYVDFLVKNKYGEMQPDGTFTRAFALTEEARELLKLELEAYISAFLESGKMIAAHKGKRTLGADDLMIVAELPINKR